MIKEFVLTSTLLLLSYDFDLLIKTTKYLLKHLLVSMTTVRQLSGTRFIGVGSDCAYQENLSIPFCWLLSESYSTIWEIPVHLSLSAYFSPI